MGTRVHVTITLTMKRWQFWLGILISLVFVYFAVRPLNLREVWQTLQTAHYLWLIPGVAVYFVAVWARAWRWHYMLRPVKAISTGKMFPIVAIGYMGNNIFPYRAGEVLRAAVLKRREGVPISASLATIIVERVYDGVVMLAFIFINLPELARLTSNNIQGIDLQYVAIGGTVVFLGALAVFLLAAMFPFVTERAANWVIARFLPARLRQRTQDLTKRFLTGLESLRSPRDALMIFLTSLVIWLLETGKYWFVMHGFDIHVSFFALMLMNGIANLLTTLPSAPGYIGTFDAACIAVLSAYGVPPSIAAGYTLVLHAALWLPITLLGAWYFIKREGLQWGKVPPDTSPGVEPVTEPKNIAVIGAGLGGLAAAYDLIRAGNLVTVLEAADYAGGLAAGFKEPGWDWTVERFYHHWFASDRHILGLIDELGWTEDVLFPRPLTVMYYKGKFYPFDSILKAILFPGLGWGINKIRFGLVGLYLRLTGNWQSLEKTTVDAWMRKWAGNRVYELMWEPLMIGKFSERYARVVNMAWMWARLHARTTRLGTFKGGFQAFADRFSARLAEMGVTVRLSTPVQRIEADPTGGLNLQTSAGNEHYDQVLFTGSPALLAKLAPALPPEYLKGLLDLKSMGAVVMILSLRRQLSPEGYYWYNIPKNAGFPYLSLVEHTNFLAKEHFGGEHIIYIGDYLNPDHEYFSLSKEELLERFLPSLERINPEFRREWVINSWLWKTAYAQPVPLVNHSSNIPDIQAPMPGLFFASMSQVYPWDRGTNFAVEIGRRAAGLMMASPAREPAGTLLKAS